MSVEKIITVNEGRRGTVEVGGATLPAVRITEDGLVEVYGTSEDGYRTIDPYFLNDRMDTRADLLASDSNWKQEWKEYFGEAENGIRGIYKATRVGKETEEVAGFFLSLGGMSILWSPFIGLFSGLANETYIRT